MPSISSSINTSPMRYGENPITSAKSADAQMANKKQGLGVPPSVNSIGQRDELVKEDVKGSLNIKQEKFIVPQQSVQSKSINEARNIEKQQKEVRQQEQRQTDINKIETVHQKIKIYNSVQEQNFPKGTISEYV